MENSNFIKASSGYLNKKQTIMVQYFKDPNIKSCTRNHRMTMAHLYLREASFSRSDRSHARKQSMCSDISDTSSQKSSDETSSSSSTSSTSNTFGTCGDEETCSHTIYKSDYNKTVAKRTDRRSHSF